MLRSLRQSLAGRLLDERGQFGDFSFVGCLSVAALVAELLLNCFQLFLGPFYFLVEDRLGEVVVLRAAVPLDPELDEWFFLCEGMIALERGVEAGVGGNGVVN